MENNMYSPYNSPINFNEFLFIFQVFSNNLPPKKQHIIRMEKFFPFVKYDK